MFNFGMFASNLPLSFNTQYRCYSVAMLSGNERKDVERGAKIILPPSALDILTRLNIVYPMLFKLTNHRLKKYTHCGVLEFVADEGKAYIPHWMMQSLLLNEGDLINIQSATLPVATFAKFQPQTVDFLDITDPKAVLEKVLRSFACLTKGDLIAIKYNDKDYELLVLETKPQDAVSIIECDMQVDFAPPVGYVDPKKEPEKKKSEEEDEISFDGIPEEYIDRGKEKLFPGTGVTLHGKKKRSKDIVDGESPVKPIIIKRGIPDLKYKIGTLVFKRKPIRPSDQTENNSGPIFRAFEGEGVSLRKKKL
uniref:Ubiquitin fusion degradation protein 1 homolog n=1 Tax=Hydra vulgaris TaxID=6087 RepID=T2M8P2_HYDVU